MKKFGLLIVLTLIMVAVPAGSVMAQPVSWDSCFQVQNLASTDAAITVEYYAQGNPTAVATPSDTVPGDGSVTYCPLSAVSDGFNGSVVITSEEPIAAIVNVTGGVPAWGAYNASYAGFDAGATTVNLPLLFQDNYGYNTWFNIQNTGDGDASVSIAYSDGASASATIGPNLAQTFDQATETHTQAVFAATITSNEEIVVTVMEVGPSPSSPMLFGYNGFVTAHTNPVMPLVQANNYGYTSGIQVQNAGSAATSVTVSFTPSIVGTACQQTMSINPGESATFALLAWDAADADSDNNCVNGEQWVGSAEVTGNTGGVDLVAIVNQHDFAGNMGASYGSFSPDLASSRVVMPLIMQDNYGYFTGFNVMNVGTSATTVSCTFSNSTYTASGTLNPGEALTDVHWGTALGDGYVGSAVCTATGGDAMIIGVVNETLLGTGQDTFLVYEAFNAD